MQHNGTAIETLGIAIETLGIAMETLGLHYIQSLHSPYYPTATAFHKDVMQYNGIVIEILGFT